MAVKDYQDLFTQASTQLNFLLLAQRNMILVLAFSLAFLGFAHNFKNRILIRLITFFLMVYSLAVGAVSSIDYLEYIRKTRSELQERNFHDGLELLENWKNWINFTYALLSINSLIVIVFIFYELTQVNGKNSMFYEGEPLRSSKSSSKSLRRTKN